MAVLEHLAAAVVVVVVTTRKSQAGLGVILQFPRILQAAVAAVAAVPVVALPLLSVPAAVAAAAAVVAAAVMSIGKEPVVLTLLALKADMAEKML